MAIDRDTWRPPAPPPRDVQGDVPGALGGSRLFDQPRYRAVRERIAAFCAPGPPVAVEVGFDHGITLLANARAQPDWRWLGVELRRRRVDAAQANAPSNCLALRIDARTLFAALLPAGRVARVDVLFPTPVLKGDHLLLTDGFVSDLRRALSADGCVHLATDVPAMAEWMAARFAGWRALPHPPPAPELSRRERVCRRDGLPVWRFTFGPSLA